MSLSMNPGEPLLDIDRLQVAFQTPKGAFPVLDGVSIRMNRSEVVGVVGESGCGKSVTSLAAMGLLPSNGRITGGDIQFGGRSLTAMKAEERRRLRGKEMAMVFQDPMTSLNPVLTIGEQMTETICLHLRMPRREALIRAADGLAQVGLSRTQTLLAEYPHQLSGGMRQRVMIAMALACDPKLLIADEPTTALDVTIQAQILDLLRGINEQRGTAVLLISHDLGVIAEMCDRVVVMYAGQVVEEAGVADLYRSPRHPYTIGLMESLPRPDKKGKPLYAIPGRVPSIHERGSGCPYASRCEHAMDRCAVERPALAAVYGGDGHAVRCFLQAVENETSRKGAEPAYA